MTMMTHLPALAVAVPLLMAALLMGAGPILSRRALDALAMATAAACLAACLSLARRSEAGPIVYWFGGWRPRSGLAPGIAFVVDPIGAGLGALASALVVAALGFSWRFFKASRSLYHALMLVFLAGMVGFGLTGDLFNLFVFFELMSVAAYALTAYKIEEEESLEGALNFAVVNSLGAFLVLFGIALLYGRTGALNLAQIGRALDGKPADGLVIAAFVLIASGFLTKGAIVPFHFWLPDAHAVAPTPASVLFSGIMVPLGAYALARVYWTAFSGPLGPHAPAPGGILLGMGAVTAVVGGVMCAAQRHLKRLLAFSTVSHMGLILMGIALMTPRALAGSMIYTVGHGLVKGALFLGAGIILHRLSSVDERVLRGRGRELPRTGALFALAGLGLAGMPPFATHPGESLISAEARRLGHGWVEIVVLLAGALTAGTVLRVALGVFLGWGPPPPDAGPTSRGDEGRETQRDDGQNPWLMTSSMAILVVLGLLAGLVPGLSERAIAQARRFVDRPAYAARVLDGAAPAARAPGPTPPEVLDPLGAAIPTALAVAVAIASLSAHRYPKAAIRAVSAPIRPPLALLKRLHSGRVGDYATWLAVGVATFGGLAGALLR